MLGLNQNTIKIQDLGDIRAIDVIDPEMAELIDKGMMDARGQERHKEVETTWDQFVQFLGDEPEVVEDKHKAGSFIPARMKPYEELKEAYTKGGVKHYRVDDNFEAVTVMVLDIDTQEAYDRCVEKLEEWGLSSVIYNTHSYSEDQPFKVRVAIELEEEIPFDEYEGVFNKIGGALGADENCKNVSRGFFKWSIHPAVKKRGNVKAFKKPYFGDPLTMEMVEQIAKEHRKELKQNNQIEELKRYDSKSVVRERIEGHRHFATGELVQQHNSPSELDLSYEGYADRHKYAIEELRKETPGSGGRHAFARDVIYKELAKAKDGFHLPSLMNFLHKVAIDDSSKPLYRGNTESEIVTLVGSAYRKSGVGSEMSRSVTSLLMDDHDHDDFDKFLADRKAKAVSYKRTGDESIFDFPGKIDLRKKKEVKVEKKELEGRDSIKARNSHLVKEYLTRGKDQKAHSQAWKSFAYKVMLNEKGLGSREAAHQTIDFILWTTDKAHETAFDRRIPKENFKKAGQQFMNNIVDKTDLAKGRIELGEDPDAIKRQLKVSLAQCLKEMKNVEPATTEMTP